MIGEVPRVFGVVAASLGALGVAGCASSALRIEQYGGMREVLHEGHAQRRIALTDAVAAPHVYAVGALENLGGEITIADGEVWVGRVESGTLRVAGPHPYSADGAALLILAHVDKWTQDTLPAAAGDDELEAAIERIAREHGIDVSRPFPFKIDGQVDRLSMHVINGVCPMAGDAGAERGREPWQFTLAQPAQGRIVGFFARDSAGEITHHGTSVHAHALLELDGARLTGHVESLTVAAGSFVRVPSSHLPAGRSDGHTQGGPSARR